MGQNVSEEGEGIAALSVVAFVEDKQICWKLSYDKRLFSKQWIKQLLEEMGQLKKQEEDEMEFILEQLLD